MHLKSIYNKCVTHISENTAFPTSCSVVLASSSFSFYQMRKDGHKDFMSPRETLLKQDLFQRPHSETVAYCLKENQSSYCWGFYTQMKSRMLQKSQMFQKILLCLLTEQLLQFGLIQQTIYRVCIFSISGPTLETSDKRQEYDLCSFALR